MLDAGLAPLPTEAIPAGLRSVARALSEAGHSAWCVGRSVGQLLAGESVHDFELSTSARPDEVLTLFPTAIATDPGRSTSTLPTGDGPVDVVSAPPDAGIEDVLQRRDFTIHALALDPENGTLADPFEGRVDLVKGLLRAPGDAVLRIAEDPLRGVRAARLVAELGFTVDPALAEALPAAGPLLAKLPRVRLREEIRALLLAPQVREGLALLRETGLEHALADGVQSDAAAVVAALPLDLELRLAGWLRGARPVSVLRRLRFPRMRVQRIEQLLQLHPIDHSVRPSQETRLRRLVRRSPGLLKALFALREAEIEAGSASPDSALAVDRLRRATQAIRRADERDRGGISLALDGTSVMAHLGCRAGPEVGRALRYLTERVREDPSQNEPDRLRALLDGWPEA